MQRGQWIQAGVDKFKNTNLCTNTNTQRFYGSRCKSFIAIVAWRFSKHYAYSPFKLKYKLRIEARLLLLKSRKNLYYIHYAWLTLGMLTFSFFWKTIVSLWKRRCKIENDTVVFKTIVFIKIVVSLKIVNDDPSLTIVNDYP